MRPVSTNQPTCGEKTQKWETLLKTPGYRVEDQIMISLDDQTLLNVSYNHPKHAVLAKATMDTYNQSINNSFENHYERMKPYGIYDMQTMLIATKNGVLFGIHKGVDIHQRLRKYNQLITDQCVDNIPLTAPVFPNRTPYQSTVLFLPDFQFDSTQLRLTRYSGSFENYEFFLERDTGIIRKIHHTISDRDATQFFSPFFEPPAFSRFYLKDRENMTAIEIYEKSARIAKSKKIRIVAFHKEADLKYTAIIDEVPKLEGRLFLDPDSSDEEDH